LSEVGLFQSNWGYLPSSVRIEIMIRALGTLFRRSGELENFKLYSPGKVANLSFERVGSLGELSEIERHVREKILPQPSLHNVMIIAYGKLSTVSEVWLEYRSENLVLSIFAVDSIDRFIGGSMSAQHSVSDVIQFASDIAEENESLKEFVGRFRDAVTFFVGEPQLLYRPKLLERFYQSRKFEDAVEPFWRMYGAVSAVFPREEALALVRASSVDFRQLQSGKIVARFCRALDEVEVHGNEVFRNMEDLVTRALREHGIRPEW